MKMKKSIRQASILTGICVLLLGALVFGAFRFDKIASLFESFSENEKIRNAIFPFSESERYVMEDVFSENPYTIEAWVYFDSEKIPQNLWPGHLISNQKSSTEDFLVVSFINQYRPRVTLRTGGVTQTITSDVSYPTDCWFLFAVTVNPENDTVTFYRDGYTMQVFNLSRDIQDSFGDLQFTLGQNAQPYGGGSFFRGRVAELNVYGMVLPGTNLRQHYSEPPTEMEHYLAGWRFINGETMGERKDEYKPMFCDLSGNAHTLKKETIWYTDYTIPEDAYILTATGDRQGIAAPYDDITPEISDRLLFLGDIVAKSNKKNWSAANSEAYRTELDAQIPVSFCLGEKDGTLYESSEFIYPEFSAFASRASGESCPTEPLDRWCIDEKNGISYLILTLRVNPTQEEVMWANAVIASHPTCNVIVATHAYLSADGNRFTQTETVTSQNGSKKMQLEGLSGEELWEELVSQHENIVAVVCSHTTYNGVLVEEDTGIYGNRVYQILCGSTVQSGYYTLRRAMVLLCFTEDSLQIRFYSPETEKYYQVENQIDLPIATQGAYQVKPESTPLAPLYWLMAGVVILLIVASVWFAWYQLINPRKQTE